MCKKLRAGAGHAGAELRMRLWSLHPGLLDRQGLIACWREALLAQAVLLGRTRGYTRHPQLERFRAHPEPESAVGEYLAHIHQEAQQRGYRFDATRIVHPPVPSGLRGNDPTGIHGTVPRISVTIGQLSYERDHLRDKLALRSPQLLDYLAQEGVPAPHPLFRIVEGGVEPWERP